MIRRYEEEEADAKPAGGAQAGAPAASAPQSFAEMQRGGQARPPAPQYGQGASPGQVSSIEPQAQAAPLSYTPGGVRPNYGPNSGDPNQGNSGQPQSAQQSPFGQSLLQRYQNYQGPGGFQSQTQKQGAPAFTPGANPFQSSFQPSSVNASYSPVQAPGMRETGGFQANQPGYTPQLEQMISQMLGSPSAYGSDAVQSSFNRLSGQIDDDFTQQTRSLEENMAQRGLSDSSIRGGKMQDLNVAKRSARTELADRLVERQAETQSADTSRAIAQAMGYGSQSFNQGLGTFNANQGANSQNFQQDLAARAFQGDQNAMEVLRNLDVAGFNRSSGQMGFDNSMQSAGFNRQLGLDQYGATRDASQFNAGEDQRGINNAESAYGINANANRQGFDQQQQLLQNLLGYEDTAFDHGMQRDTFNADNQYRDKAMELSAYLQTLNTGAPGAPSGGRKVFLPPYGFVEESQIPLLMAGGGR